MYTKQRFLTNNKITAVSMVTPSSQAEGRVSGVSTIAEGTALWVSAGAYDGSRDILVTIQIDDVSAGKEIGQATFSWKTSLSTGWEATGVATATTPTALGTDGKTIAWQAGTGDDLEMGDVGVFWCYASFGPENLLLFDRNAYWKTTSDTSENVVVNFGSAQLVTAFVIADHNLTSGATITLQANTTDAWSPPAYTQVITYGDPAVLYLSETYQYWRVLIADASNPDTYLRIGKLYLGTYTELAAETARPNWGVNIAHKRHLISTDAETGRENQRIWSIQQALTLSYEYLSETDMETLYSIWASVHNLDTGAVNPFWFHYFQDDADYLFMMRIVNDFNQTFKRYNVFSVSIDLREVVKTRL
jgi:hypothetical protein